ncbi:MAG: pseudouridine synthase [Verrucomicrobiales bacterium]|nr:pseudouridine synthase [Verrucomicrobiales bacterium]
MKIRLQKFLSEAGVASRRAAELLILQERVAVNGEPVRQLGVKVDPARDRVTVDGQPARPRPKLYVALHKPRGCICTRRDEAGRPTVFEFLPDAWRNLYPVGRLDFNTEGLLLLTNDGEFALRVTHPRYGVRKRYQATVNGRVTRELLERLERGIRHQGESLKAERVRLLHQGPSRAVVELELAEGRKREARRLFESQGFTVRRLVRTHIGPVALGALQPGRWRQLTPAEIKSLLSQP